MERWRRGPERSHRKGITLLELAERFPTEESARQWFESIVWPNEGERDCPGCGSLNTHECSHAKMPYRCRDCGKYFSVKTGTVMAGSPLPIRKWVYAIYLDATSLKGVSSMKLHRDIGVTQKTAWFMQQRIREAFAEVGPLVFNGPVEVDETLVGGKRKNMSAARRKELEGQRGPAVGKTVVVGVKDRETGQVAARVIDTVDGRTLNSFVDAHTDPDAEVYTDGSSVYRDRDNHESVAHSAGEYVRYLEGAAIHTNGVESFWSMLKRAHKGTFHRLSPNHLQRYVNEFAGRHNLRERDTTDIMARIATLMIREAAPVPGLIADNGRSPVAG